MLSVLLLELLNDNDRIIVENLYNEYYNWMLVSAKSKLRGRSDIDNVAEEAVQAAFVRIIENIERLDLKTDKKHIKALLSIIAQNEAINIIRKDNPSVPLSDVEYVISDEDFVKKFEMRDEYEYVKRAINDLDYPYRAILYLRFVQGKSVDEISTILNINKNTLYKKLNKGKLMLLELIHENQTNKDKKYELTLS